MSLSVLLVALGAPTAQAACDLVVEPGEDAQAAVDCAEPGDTVTLAAGVHRQGLVVTTPDLVITGEGRGVTVLDGTGIRAHGIYVIAGGVTVQDLTVSNFRGNGVFWDGVDGFLAQRVDAIRNGPYGIYAIRSTNGAFLDSYAAGHADSGVYLGEVEHCNCLIDGIVSVDNLIGYSGTGASDIEMRNSHWARNAAGIVPNVLPGEPKPQLNLWIHHNVVEDNNNETAGGRWHFSGIAHVPPGLGIVIAGGSMNRVEDNVVRNHGRAGIAVAWLFTEPSLNEVRDNALEDNALDIIWDAGGVNNCFEGNHQIDGEPLTFDAGTVWNTAGFLPDCDTPNAGAPDARIMARLLSLVVFGCEPEQQPGDPCHLEGVWEDGYP